MNQTKLESLLESVINNLTGIITSLLAFNYIVVPIWNFEASWLDNIGITLIFTFISMIRSYFWRRFFNKGVHKKVHIFVKQLKLKSK